MKVLPPLAPSPTVFWFDIGSTFAARLYLLFLIWEHKRKNTPQKTLGPQANWRTKLSACTRYPSQYWGIKSLKSLLDIKLYFDSIFRLIKVEWRGDHDNDFNQTIILEEIKRILTRPEMTGNHSVFFFNVGIHYSLVLNFTTYRRLIQSLITLLKRDNLGSKALQIWRSSTAIEREHLKKLYAGDNLTKWRFHTSPVIPFFYSQSALKK